MNIKNGLIIIANTEVWVSKFTVSTKICIFFWTFDSLKNPEKNNVWLSSQTNIDNNNNQHIRMISEGSCYSEDWSNGCWKSSFSIKAINLIKKITHFKITIIFHNTAVFWLNKCTYGELFFEIPWRTMWIPCSSLYHGTATALFISDRTWRAFILVGTVITTFSFSRYNIWLMGHPQTAH